MLLKGHSVDGHWSRLLLNLLLLFWKIIPGRHWSLELFIIRLLTIELLMGGSIWYLTMVERLLLEAILGRLLLLLFRSFEELVVHLLLLLLGDLSNWLRSLLGLLLRLLRRLLLLEVLLLLIFLLSWLLWLLDELLKHLLLLVRVLHLLHLVLLLDLTLKRCFTGSNLAGDVQ